jgi:hypothetical protein
MRFPPLPRTCPVPVRCHLVVCLLALTASHAAAQSTVRADSAHFAGAPVFRLRNGMNAIDPTGTGTRGTVMVARRPNYNAHGYSLATFYAVGKDDASDHAVWQLIPFMAGVPREEAAHTHEGADCIIQDVRVLRPARAGPLTVVIGHRTVAQTYADAEAVTFTIYELRRNDTHEMGEPLYRFELTRQIHPRRAYCDINEAFARELGLGTTGIATWQPDR